MLSACGSKEALGSTAGLQSAQQQLQQRLRPRACSAGHAESGQAARLDAIRKRNRDVSASALGQERSHNLPRGCKFLFKRRRRGVNLAETCMHHSVQLGIERAGGHPRGLQLPRRHRGRARGVRTRQRLAVRLVAPPVHLLTSFIAVKYTLTSSAFEFSCV